MFDHWGLLRNEKAVKLMLSKDPNDIAQQKGSDTVALGTKPKQGYFVWFFSRGIRAVRRYKFNICFKSGIG